MTGTPLPELPPMPENERGFDFFMTPGYDLIKSLEEDDDEATPLRPPPAWVDVKLDVTGDEPEFNNGQPVLNGFRYAMRYWQTRTDYNEIDNTNDPEIVYPAWELVSQTFEQISAAGPPSNRRVFLTDTGDEVFPISHTGDVGAGVVLGSGGITNGTQYGYLQVFNDCEISYLPRCSTLLQVKEPIENTLLPLQGTIKEDPPYPWFPMDTVNALIVDERTEVQITYRVTTVYRASLLASVFPGYEPPDEELMQEYEHTQLITQVCVQDPEITPEKMEAIMNKCYFTYGYYHNQLYEVDAAPNYDSKGNPVGPVIDPQYEVDKEATDMVGFTVYKLVNSVWNSNGLEDVPAQEEESAKQEKKVERRIKPQIEGLDETVTSIETNYATEVESITQNQEEYKEFVQANKDKKQSLLDNMLTMMNLPAGSVPEITPENLNQFITEANQRNANGGN